MMSIEEARSFARRAHRGQVDNGGRPYHEHVEAVSEMLAEYGTDAMMAGLLHDIIEDTDVTDEDLRSLGVPDVVVDAVLSVSRQPGETYMDMIRRAAAHPLGRLVKLADNAHNSSPERLEVLSAVESMFLSKRYAKARKVLFDAAMEDQ